MSTPEIARANFDTWRALAGRNTYESDSHLASLLRFHGREEHAPALREFAGVCEDLDALINENNRDENLPVLRRWDGQGKRVEAVAFHPTYHQIGRALYASGVMSRYAQVGREFETMTLAYTAGQNGEAGHCCPFACTAGLIKILQNGDGSAPAEWLPRLLDPNYDTHFHGAQFLTEVQGGSDVGANFVRAEPAGDGSYRITGEKWFCSVVDAQLMLVTARVGDDKGTRGVMAFGVPRLLDDGRVNDFAIRRLKFKLGTKSMASGEIDFEGAWAWPLGSFKDTVEVVLNTSRLYNAIISCGIMQRAVREASAYARTRTSWGQPILRYPSVARTIAELKTQAYAARSVTFWLSAMADRDALGQLSTDEQQAWRMLVNLNKFWTSFQCTASIRDAIEVLGGNGAIEEFSVLPRLLRDSIVCEQWEGPHNILCAQVLRDSARLGLHEPMFRVLEALVGPTDELQRARARWDQLLQMPPALQTAHVRDVAIELQIAVQATLLAAEAKAPGTDPMLPVIVEHFRTSNARGYDPLADTGLLKRVVAIVAE